MLEFQLVGVLGLVAVIACWTFAAVLYRAGPAGSVSRKLALLLVIEGITLGTGGYPELSLGLTLPQVADQYPLYDQIAFITHTIGDCALLMLYPPFLATALHTKLTRPFASGEMRIALAVASLGMFFAAYLSPLEIGATLLFASLSLVFGFALVASIHAWWVAPAGIVRNRAGIFALAFGLRDICWGVVYVSAIWRIHAGTYLTEEQPLSIYIIYALGTLLYIPFIAYGILRTQLFDIDLRIRWTIKQSTVAAVFVAVFYLVSEGADRLLASEFGNIIGLIASALVVFFLVPVQRFAERVANTAMPNTENTPEYKMFRKLQVYEAALTEALPDGDISERERDLLERLRDSLGISPADADAIERELQKGVPSNG
jgi:hypothetical protein